MLRDCYFVPPSRIGISKIYLCDVLKGVDALENYTSFSTSLLSFAFNFSYTGFEHVFWSLYFMNYSLFEQHSSSYLFKIAIKKLLYFFPFFRQLLVTKLHLFLPFKISSTITVPTNYRVMVVMHTKKC